MSNTKFRPVRGTEDKIKLMPYMDGYTYFATDSGKIYLDVNNERKVMGGSGAAVLYSSLDNIAQSDIDDTYLIDTDGIDDESIPRVGDLIINKDGTFYKVLTIDGQTNYCAKIAVSGTGGSSSGSETVFSRGRLKVENTGESNILNGSDCIFSILGTSATEDGIAIDDSVDAMTVKIEYYELEATVPYYSETINVTHNVSTTYNAASNLRESTTTKIIFTLSGSASNKFYSNGQVTRTVTTTSLTLNWLEASFNNNSYFDTTSKPLTIRVNTSTSLIRIYDLYFDDILVHTEVLNDKATPNSFTITSTSPIYNLDGSLTGSTIADIFTHGAHTISAILSLQNSSGNRGSSTDKITKEIALYLEEKPLIWIGDLDTTYYEYDTIFVPYRVYDPNVANNSDGLVHVYLYKDGARIEDTYRGISNNASDWSTWEINDLSTEENSTYTIRVGQGATEVRRDLTFTILADPRNMQPASDVKMSFYSKGRSNTENKSKRQTVVFNNKNSVFSNFNWYNNGWITTDRQTSLKITNGAEFKLPIGALTFGAVMPHSIEFKIKISNVQDYSTIITSYTRYKYVDDNNEWYDDSLFAAFLAQRSETAGYTNYDAYLTHQLPIEKAKGTGFVPLYDDLQYSGQYKDYNLTNAIALYKADSANVSTDPAICFGPQDGFFSNGTDSVSVNYVENEIINVAIVSSGGSTLKGDDNLMKIYINGMLTGVVRSTKSKNGSENNTWTIGDSDTYFVFKSDVCDIDLYNFRVYDKALDIKEVLSNYAYDNIDTLQWDLANNLYEILNDKYTFSYSKMLEYNSSENVKKGKLQPIMPYIVFTTDDTKESDSKGNLPWFKTESDSSGVSHYEKVDMEFVNPSLDIAYSRGLLSELAAAEGYEDEEDLTAVQNYYLHHCPSWTSSNIDLGVQGTSSEFYPRRNYKAKTKVDAPVLDENNVQETEIHTMDLGNGQSISYTEYKVDDEYEMIPHKGPFATEYEQSSEDSYRRIENFYYDNSVVGTNKFTLKVDFMESSGSYNMGLANLLNNAYSHHPLEDYVSHHAINKKNSDDTYSETTIGNLDKYRTTVQGFPTLAFHQTKSNAAAGNDPVFIGKYNMLIDKGSDEMFGFKVKGYQAFKENKDIKKIAECWEFENNNRGFCSFRDPWNRKELSFAAPEGTKDSAALTTNGAPVVADSFEYRYHTDKDYIDLLVHLNNSSESNQARIELYDKYGIDIGNSDGKQLGRDKLIELYSNWEKAVKWVWSTATDAQIDINGDGNLVSIPSLGTYEEIELATEFKSDTYYTRGYEDNNEIYRIYVGDFNSNLTYYQKIGDSYASIRLTNEDAKIYKANTYYTLVNGNYILSESTAIDELETYYKLTTSENIDSAWKLENPVIYGTQTFEYDTKEYRLAKFKNELTQHFNFEYLVTYFVITEILECYDSRGKNCMMASWGPQSESGDYIWYPIFYDMDTQLGINNTGIPSFDYDIDATEEGSFSTNDSVLWNNLYSVFKNSISQKYQQLKGTATEEFIGSNTTSAGKLNNPPLSSVDKIEQFYSCDPDLYGSYSMKGERPLLALNIDEQYKYIDITDVNNGNYTIQADGTKIAIPPVKAGYVGSSTLAPVWKGDDTDTYFYALQGNRSLSRRQFLTNRLNYIDSWLNVGNFARAGENRIRSRVSANSSVNTSDHWIEGEATNGDNGLTVNSSYYKEDGTTKSHLFDGEYWITMTPARSMYVTVGTDAANFPSLKYTGTPVRFETADLENGVRKSGNYREQLYYIYGLDQMKSLGDLSKLYFQEFALEGSISKLSDLRLGYDGLDEDNNPYKNSGVNDWTIPGSAESATGGMPLLKEVNLCNITFKNENKVIDLSSCTKLQNFRCTGSNLVGVTFAEGVSLHTLYLSEKITTLNLVEARLLTKLIETYTTPKLNNDTGLLEAEEGLYIAGLTDRNSSDEATTAITTLNIKGGNLGYNSYILLQKYYEACIKSSGTTRKIDMTDVVWSPYTLVETGSEYDSTKNYYYDNGHFGLTEFNSETDNWNNLLASEILYEDNPAEDYKAISDASLLTNLLSTEYNFKGLTTTYPNITGIIYIENTETINEDEIQKNIQLKYPNLTIFFATVNKGYSARFVIKDKTTGAETLIGTDKIGVSDYKENKEIFFTSPLNRTEEDFNGENIDSLLPSQDFLGWSTSNDRDNIVISYDENWVNELEETSINTWSDLRLIENQFDYTFYAVFEDHKWNVVYYMINDSGEKDLIYTEKIVNNSYLQDPMLLVARDESNLDNEMRYTLVGYNRTPIGLNIFDNKSSASIVDLTKIKASSDLDFYAVFIKESVYSSVTNLDYFDFTEYEYYESNSDGTYNVNSPYNIEGYRISPKNGVSLQGKITLPVIYNGKPIIGISDFGGQDSTSLQPNITHLFWIDKDNCELRLISDFAFKGCTKLQYFVFTPKIRVIRSYAFNECSLDYNYSNLLNCNALYFVGSYAFDNAFTTSAANSIISNLYIPGSIEYLGEASFAFQNKVSSITLISIGAYNDPTCLSSNSNVGGRPLKQNSGHGGTDITVYCDGGTPSQELMTIASEKFYNGDGVQVSYANSNGGNN